MPMEPILPRSSYVSIEEYRPEQERVFFRQWIWVGRVEESPEAVGPGQSSDWQACQLVQRGMTRRFTTGFYAPMEVWSKDIRRYIGDQLG
jgi:phenylpropionate dioxygenase-like ring-hydroxylating dioxygenase large terminal subunit